MKIGEEKLWRIFEVVRTQRWFAQKHVKPTSISVCDSLEFDLTDGVTHSWLLLKVEPEDRVYSVTISENADGTPKLASPAYLMDFATRHPVITTAHGGAIVTSNSVQGFSALKAEPLEPCNSSNSLYSAGFHDQNCVAKFYRKMDAAGRRERRTLSAMDASGLTPSLLGSIEYRAPNQSKGEEPQTLCLFLEMVEGQPAYEPFQKAARTAIGRLRSGSSLDTVLDDDDCTLPEDCATLGRLIAEFHGAANAVMPIEMPSHPLNLGSSIDNLQDRWTRLERMAGKSPSAPVLKGLAPTDQLADLETFEPLSIKPSYSHGDLHLSHIIFEQGQGRGRIIDPAHGIGEPNNTDHSARDLLQICRGFECFIFDEVATFLATTSGKSREEAAACLADPDNAMAAQWMHFAERWSDTVFRAVLAAYLSAIPIELAQPASDPAWRSLFYLERLFHELEYNISYDRAFFLSADIAFLRNFNRSFNSRAALLLPRKSAALHPHSAASRRSDKEDAHVVY